MNNGEQSLPRTCRYRADMPCEYPILKCENCKYYIEPVYTDMKKESSLSALMRNVPNPMPYVKLEDATGRRAIEIGIKGTF